MKVKLFAYASRFTPFSPIHLSVQEYENPHDSQLKMMLLGEFEIDLPLKLPTNEEFSAFVVAANKSARLERMETLQRQLAALEALPTDAYDQITQADGPGSLL